MNIDCEYIHLCVDVLHLMTQLCLYTLRWDVTNFMKTSIHHLGFYLTCAQTNTQIYVYCNTWGCLDITNQSYTIAKCAFGIPRVFSVMNGYDMQAKSRIGDAIRTMIRQTVAVIRPDKSDYNCMCEIDLTHIAATLIKVYILIDASWPWDTWNAQFKCKCGLQMGHTCV